VLKVESKTVKISEPNYKAICEFAGELQIELGEPVSINKALSYVLKRKKLSDLAGTWKMNDKEADEMLKSLDKG
jgi:hypothetical protein